MNLNYEDYYEGALWGGDLSFRLFLLSLEDFRPPFLEWPINGPVTWGTENIFDSRRNQRMAMEL